MNFASSVVPKAILQILDSILAAWPTLPTEVRQAIVRAVRQHGPDIGIARDAISATSAAGAFLNALWPVRQDLPADVRDALAAGQVDAQPKTPYVRSVSLGALSEEQKLLVLQRMIRIVDFRLYRDPMGLTAAVDALVDVHEARLSDDERSQLAALRRGHERRAADLEVAEAYLRSVEALLGAYPAVMRLLDAQDAKVWADSLRTRGGSLPAPVQESTELRPGDASDDVARYANVHFPNKVLVDQAAVPLIVHVAGHFQAGAKGIADEARMSLKLSPLTVIVRPEGFEVTDATIGGAPVDGAASHVRQVEVFRERDCEPLIFFLKPQLAGKRRICVDFEQFKRRILTVAFEVEVLDDAAALRKVANAAVTLASMASPLLGSEALPPDLELRIMLSADHRTLDYMLHSPRSSDYHFKTVGSKSLRDDPLTFMQPIFNQLSDLARKSVTTRSADETRRANQQLTAIGVQLYDQLFSEELKREYSRVLRKRYRGKSLLITTDDPWIPWELVTPQDPGEDAAWDEPTDPPLCETFRLSRWVAGRGAPDQLKLAQGVWVAPPDN